MECMRDFDKNDKKLFVPNEIENGKCLDIVSYSSLSKYFESHGS